MGTVGPVPAGMWKISWGKVSENTLSSHEWIATRIGPKTSTLSIKFRALEVTARHGNDAALMQTYLCRAHLSQLKCLEILELTHGRRGKAVTYFFSDWLLRRLPGLCAWSLAARSWHYAGGSSRLEHLKHLQTGAGSLYSGQLQAGVQLPLLQTLCIDGGDCAQACQD